MAIDKETVASFESGKLRLQDLNGKIFVIPYYQRGYRWTENEAKKLFSDFLEFTKSGETDYCLQPIVLQHIDEIPAEYKNFPGRGNKTCFRVVDGQQRLTTIAILMDVLGCGKEWEIYYISEGKTLSEILEASNDVSDNPRPINDYFRNEVWNAFDRCEDNEKEAVKKLLQSNDQTVSFLCYEIPLDCNDPEGHQAFLRLNDGKTPLTSSELIKALYMVNASGLGEEERMEVAKEWEIIENTLRDEQFWLMFNSKGLSDTPTRIDLLFALVMNVRLEDAKANPRIVFEEIDKHPDWDLYKVWQAVLRCFWWMKSCYADVELFNYLCWVREFTDNSAKKIYDNWRKYPGPEDFKKSVVEIIQNNYKEKTGLEQFNYDCDKNELRKLFVLLNVIDCNHNKERFRFDLYKKESWDIEHIDSQTPNELPDDDSKKEWLRSSFEELAEKGKAEFRESFKEFDEKDNSSLLEDFENKANKILELWGWDVESSEISDDDKNMIGNLALLNTHINRSYKNAIFPAKRKVIKEFIVKGDCYVPPCTAKAFMKFYTETTSKITYWLKADFDGYASQLNAYFKELINKSTELPEKKQPRKDDFSKNNQGAAYTHLSESRHLAAVSSDEARLSGEVSFEQFMEKYQVVIPKIQRLYVQGREDSYGKKCLSSFASRLVDSVTRKESCHLDFIYGIDCDNGKVFEPLDGQQRLTTLFLLAWLCGKTKDSWVIKYESRRATECFVRGLLNNKPPELKQLVDFYERMDGIKNSPRPFLPLCSDTIREADWFLSAWEEDAGIAGMLEMLDSLYCKLLMSGVHEFDFTGIAFFVNYLDAARRSYDQIFLKMNSRGKSLTRWECIKAVLDQHVPVEMRVFWREKLNNTWQEQLWMNMHDKDIDRLDTVMLSVVELALRCAGYKEKINNTFQLASWFANKENADRCKEFYALCSTFFSVLEVVCVDGANDLDSALTPAWETTAHCPDFTHDDYYKPLLAYYAARQSANADWMRVIWNIVENCGISKGNFPSAYLLLKELSAQKDSILEFLANDVAIESRFAIAQINEEREKAKRILSTEGNAWRGAIVDMEKHRLLRGKIIGIFASVKDGTHVQLENSIEEFKKRSASFEVLANAIGDKKSMTTVCAALLSCGDYTRWCGGNNWRFIVDEQSLDEYLHVIELSNDDKFFSVFFDLLNKASDIADYGRLCNGFKDLGNWRYYFIKYRDRFLSGEGYYAWPGDFSCRKINGKTLHSHHYNPYMDTAGIQSSHTGNDFKIYINDKTISVLEEEECVSVSVSVQGGEQKYRWNRNSDFVEWLRENVTRLCLDFVRKD